MDQLWTPNRVLPTEGKKDGGSYFDDEMEKSADVQKRQQQQSLDMRRHLQQRPDHTIFVASDQDRHEMRKVLNHWRKVGEILTVPNIKIDYGIPEGQIRIGER